MAELPRGDYTVKELDVNLDAKVDLKADVKKDVSADVKLDHDLDANINKNVTENSTQTVTETSTQNVTETSTQNITETSTQNVTETSTQTIEQTVAQTVRETLEQILTANLTHVLNFGGSFKIEGLDNKWGLNDALAIDNLNRQFIHNLLRGIQGAVLDHYGDVAEAYHIPLKEYTWLTTMKVVDALDSTSDTDILSANQGRVLREMIENAVEQLNTAIAAEATARADADTALQSSLTAETTARKAADTTLQNNINAEATARASGDTANANALTTHISSTNPHPNLELATLGGNLPFTRISGTLGLDRTTGNLPTSRITGNLDASRIDGLVALIKANTISEGNVNPNGYAKFGNGLIIQWGTTPTQTSSTEDEFTQNFPITFPNNCFSVIMSMNITANKSNDANYWPQLLGHNRYSFSYWYQAADRNAPCDYRIEFVAFGN